MLNGRARPLQVQPRTAVRAALPMPYPIAHLVAAPWFRGNRAVPAYLALSSIASA
jgi:hypothetical protein